MVRVRMVPVLSASCFRRPCPPTQVHRLPPPLSVSTGRRSLRSGRRDHSDIIVDWEGPDDPMNPKNWSRNKKWKATIIVSLFTLISPVSSSMIAPASGQVAERFGVTNTVVIALFTSIFILSYAIGPLFLGPLSEIYGRNKVIQGANLWYLCGTSRADSHKHRPTPRVQISRWSRRECTFGDWWWVARRYMEP
ncbi:hypothetical protein FB45DRAFT_280497 [Roridomyces roridus]|uniref:Major facilitator superfamily (MFS) profile domain-containing protein n=1 Tax=Roridomyces roridus TaxID=1738132 RepID=A0AAD7FWR8_9AGAR|nr:hypothetical protein FB45DRAFT_280497 [Roridomyces roridus]